MSDSILSSVLPNNSIRSLVPRDEHSTIYVTNSSNLSQREDVIPQTDVIQTFTSSSFGATSVFRLSKAYQFLSHMFVRIKITIAGGDSNFITDYPAYSFIKTVKYVVGSTEQLILYGPSMLDMIHEQCENDESKKLMIHELSGNREMGAGVYYIYAFLPLPWSSIKANKLFQGQKPFPIHALNDNIELQIELNTGAAVGTTNLTVNDAALLFKFLKIGNHEQLIREKIRYPFKQPINLQTFNITDTAAGTAESFYLTNFRKGECTDILLHLSSNITNQSGDVYNGFPMTNIQLFFNGVRIWNANQSDRMWDILTADAASVYGKKKIRIKNVIATGTAANVPMQDLNGVPIVQATVFTDGAYFDVDGYSVYPANQSGIAKDSRQFYYVIPFGEIRQKMLNSGNNYALSGDFSRQSLQITFNIPTLTGTSILFVSYVYTAIYQLDEYGSAILAF